MTPPLSAHILMWAMRAQNEVSGCDVSSVCPYPGRECWDVQISAMMFQISSSLHQVFQMKGSHCFHLRWPSNYADASSHVSHSMLHVNDQAFRISRTASSSDYALMSTPTLYVPSRRDVSSDCNLAMRQMSLQPCRFYWIMSLHMKLRPSCVFQGRWCSSFSLLI